MAGTKQGGIAAAITNKSRYGQNYYISMGALGGKKGAKDGAIKGFAAMTPEKRAAAGKKGGSKSRRGQALEDLLHYEKPKRFTIFKKRG